MSDRHRRRRFDPELGLTCHYCKALLTRRNYTKDHIVPLSKNGKDERWNIVDSCRSCNEAKADKWPTADICNCRFCRKSVRIHREAYKIKPPKP